MMKKVVTHFCVTIFLFVFLICLKEEKRKRFQPLENKNGFEKISEDFYKKKARFI